MNVPPYCVVAGNPAGIKKYRFDEETIGLLLKLKWWDKPIEEIKKIVPVISSGEIKDIKKELERLLECFKRATRQPKTSETTVFYEFSPGKRSFFKSFVCRL